MNLLIDSGNSLIKWALVENDAFIAEDRCPTDSVSSLHDLWKNYEIPARVIVANVAGEWVASEIKKVARILWQLDAEFLVSSKSCCGLTNSYHKPEQLGIDRWMAMVAAFQMTQSPVIVVDCGTAVTIDLVNDYGLFLGGVIMPGLNTALQSLMADTDAIEKIIEANTIAIAAALSTEEAVQAGVLLGLAGGIERVVREHVLYIDKEASILITGGDAEKITAYLSVSAVVQADLVLQGLRVFAEKNGPGLLA